MGVRRWNLTIKRHHDFLIMFGVGLSIISCAPSQAQTKVQSRESEPVASAHHADQGDGGRVMEHGYQQKFFDLINTLSVKHNFNPESLAGILGGPLQYVANESSPPNWNMYKNDKLPGIFKAAELRTKQPYKIGLLILTLSSGFGLSTKDIYNRFGNEFSIAPPSPHGGPRQTAYIYQYKWGVMKFLIDEKDQLVSVVLDSF